MARTRSTAARTRSRKKAGKRELVTTGRGKRFVRRNRRGQFKDSVDVGRSLAQDRRRKAKAAAKSGHGDRGDRKASRSKTVTVISRTTGDANRDPITGTPGAHPVGTGLGATAGGAAGGAALGAAGAAIGAATGTVLGGPVGTAIGGAAGIIAGALAGGGAGKIVAETANPTVVRRNRVVHVRKRTVKSRRVSVRSGGKRRRS